MANTKMTSSPKLRKGKVFDLDKLQQPLKEGWIREVVIRASSTTTKKRCDIYYHPPKGSKLRSAIEVQKFCENKNKSYKLSAEFELKFKEWAEANLSDLDIPYKF